MEYDLKTLVRDFRPSPRVTSIQPTVPRKLTVDGDVKVDVAASVSTRCIAQALMRNGGGNHQTVGATTGRKMPPRFVILVVLTTSGDEQWT